MSKRKRKKLDGCLQRDGEPGVATPVELEVTFAPTPDVEERLKHIYDLLARRGHKRLEEDEEPSPGERP